MKLKLAASSLQWSQPSVPRTPPSPQTLASAIPSPSSSKRRSFVTGDGALSWRYAGSTRLLHRSCSCDNFARSLRVGRRLPRALTASLASFSDEEFSREVQELAIRFRLSDDCDHAGVSSSSEGHEDEIRNGDSEERPFGDDGSRGDEAKLLMENVKGFYSAFDFPEREEDIIPCDIERKANSVEIPLSLRMIKRKKQQWREGLMESGESAYSSIKKAFSSMVFIIQELHSYSLKMREVLFYEDLQGILASVQKEMHMSFVWLFEKVFSHTPTLMVYVMILLANYSVYSMSSSTAIAAATPPPIVQSYEEDVSVVDDDQSLAKKKFDSSSIVRMTNKLSYSDGKTISVGGNSGGGKIRPVASGTDGDGRFEESNHLDHRTITPDGLSGNPLRTSGEESVSRKEEDEVTLWNEIEEDPSRMEAESGRDEALDHQTMVNLASPGIAKIEADYDYSDYLRLELLYQTELAQDPNNPLLLANFAQFLYLFVQDFDRAEDYFKRAIKVEPKDADALNKYANFLWLVREDLWAAEETYQEAIAAEPDNPFYTADYARFLWGTSGEDTCFPLS